MGWPCGPLTFREDLLDQARSCYCHRSALTIASRQYDARRSRR